MELETLLSLAIVALESDTERGAFKIFHGDATASWLVKLILKIRSTATARSRMVAGAF